jgi:hypothetical protein
VAAIAAVFAWNAWRTAPEAEVLPPVPDTVLDDHGGDMPVGELIKITGVSSASASINLRIKTNQLSPSILCFTVTKQFRYLKYDSAVANNCIGILPVHACQLGAVKNCILCSSERG